VVFLPLPPFNPKKRKKTLKKQDFENKKKDLKI
jgi:hypothetical protein